MVTTFQKIKNRTSSHREQNVLFGKNTLEQTTDNILYKNNQNQFPVNIDRLFICVRDGEQATNFLEKLGLKSHQSIIRSVSQGTLSKIFFFNNLYLEIIWLEREISQKREELTTTINFKARANWKQNKMSPVGIGLSGDLQNRNNNSFLLDTHFVKDLILDDLFCCFQQNCKNYLEPFIFLLPEYLTVRDNLQIINSESVEHPLGVTRVTNIRINLLRGRRRSSNILKILNSSNILQVEYSDNPLIEITLDCGVSRQVIDTRPVLPLILKY